MTITSGPESTPRQRTRRVWPWVLLGLVVVVAGIVAVMLGRAMWSGARPVPDFTSLVQTPDTSISGTVAYTDGQGCIHVAAASGQQSKVVHCLPPVDIKEAQAMGKPLGPQLVWLEDGRLQMTMFRMTDPPGPDYNPGWQQVIDVRTGEVTDVDTPAPSVPDRTTRPLVNSAGDEVSFTSKEDGTVTVVLTTADGVTRTLVDVQGPAGPYGGYRMTGFWAPTGDWILAEDGRILVITPTEPPLTRVLVDRPERSDIIGEFGPAVTAQDVLGDES